MRFNSKIRFLLITIVISFILGSCKNEKNDVIPDVYVNFIIDLLNDIEFADLNVTGNHVIVTSLTNNWGINSAGFANNGIIVFRSLSEEFNAYDRTCPHDYFINNQIIKVDVEFTSAICPNCSTKYALSAFGTPLSGPGRYPLKNYKTSFDGRYLSVWNE